jgi:hypothetical protein
MANYFQYSVNVPYRYNAELAPAELRGSLVSLQQLAITFGIMVSYWIGKLSFAVFQTVR